MDDYKQRVILAVEKFSEKQLAKPNATYRRNEHPEQLVVKDCIKWMKQQGWSIHIIESKAQWDKDSDMYRAKAAPVGFADSVGCMKNGRAVFVEFKAKGKRSTLKEHQAAFLDDKIDKFCFACCVDSLEKLKELYSRWQNLMNSSQQEKARQFLREDLPRKVRDQSPLFP